MNFTWPLDQYNFLVNSDRTTLRRVLRSVSDHFSTRSSDREYSTSRFGKLDPPAAVEPPIRALAFADAYANAYSCSSYAPASTDWVRSLSGSCCPRAGSANSHTRPVRIQTKWNILLPSNDEELGSYNSIFSEHGAITRQVRARAGVIIQDFDRVC